MRLLFISLLLNFALSNCTNDTDFCILFSKRGPLHKSIFNPITKTLYISNHRTHDNELFEITPDVFPDNIESIELDNCLVKENIDLTQKTNLTYLRFRNCMNGVLNASNFPQNLKHFRLYKSGNEILNGIFPINIESIKLEVQGKFSHSHSALKHLTNLTYLEILSDDKINIELPPNIEILVLHSNEYINVQINHLHQLKELRLYSPTTSFLISTRLPRTLEQLVVTGKSVAIQKDAINSLTNLRQLEVRALNENIKIHHYIFDAITYYIGYNWLRI